MKRKLSGKRLQAAFLAALLALGSASGYVKAEAVNQTTEGTALSEQTGEEEIPSEDTSVSSKEESPSEEFAEQSSAKEDDLKEEEDSAEEGVKTEEEQSPEEGEQKEEEMPEIPEADTPEENVEKIQEQEVLTEQGELLEDEIEGEENISAMEILDEEELILEDVGEEEVTEPDLLSASTPNMEGSAITSSGSSYKLVTSGSEVYKGNYNLLGDANNRSRFVFSPFNYAGSDVTYIDTGGVIYFVPRNGNAAGKYGFLVQNVGFNCEKNCGLDMKFTVTGYKDYVIDNKGEGVNGIYPAFGFWKNYGLCFAFGGADQNIKVEILEHGTNTPVKGDYSFRWLDIDAGQRFGISLIDGTLSGRYALATCSAYYQNDFSRFGRSYHMVNAAQDTDYSGKTGSWLDGTVYWEVKECSQMNLLIATAGNSQQGRRSAATSKERYKQYSTGNFSDETGVNLGLLAWDGESYGAKENPMPLYKYVSSTETEVTALAEKTSNTLSSVGESFYYYLTNHVPVESPDYYYDLYTVTDALPQGADYDGQLQVIKAETGQDVTSWFQSTVEKDVITLQANNLSDSSFYGSTYVFKIRVKMDTTEITPVCQNNLRTYQIENYASVSSRHRTEKEAKTAVSPTVRTTLQELGKGKIRINKTDDSKNLLTGASFEIRAAENITSPSGAVLASQGTLVETITTVDGRAVSGELYAGKYLVTEVLPPEGYSLTAPPQTVEVTDIEGGAQSAELTFVDQPTRVYLKKTSELLEGEQERTPLQGVVFAVWEKGKEEESGQNFVTDENGRIALSGLKPATYCYREKNAPAGYVQDLQYGKFTIDKKGLTGGEYGHEILVENSCIKAEFSKTDRGTGEAVAGATMQLTDQNGREIETWISETIPHRINRLPCGTYILNELEAPSGYAKGEAVTCVVEDTAEVQTFTLADIKYVTVTLTKKIHNSQVVQAHGNPTFVFCLTGVGLDGQEYTKYQTVVFGEKEIGTEGDAVLQAVLTVPAGKYTASEEKTGRYVLEGISDVKNGTVEEGKVLFDLSANQNGAATFTNTKITDELLSHTDFVRNVIIEEQSDN